MSVLEGVDYKYVNIVYIMYTYIQVYITRKLTWNLKLTLLKGRTSFFGFHVSFREGNLSFPLKEKLHVFWSLFVSVAFSLGSQMSGR